MIRTILACLLLIVGLSLGYWVGRLDVLKNPNPAAVGEKKPLYYRHPMNPNVTSMTPTKDEMGMDYVAVYAEDSTANVLSPTSGKILYYRHPVIDKSSP